MAGTDYKISFSIGGKIDAAGAITKDVLPLMHKAVRGIAQYTASSWQEAVLRQRGLWSEEKDAYAASIKYEMTGDFTAVVSSDYKWVEDIETGRPARDLKRMLDTSHKVRRTPDGRRFLIIPFRHNTPGNDAHAAAMPAGVYGLAKAMEGSTVTENGQRPSGQVVHLSPKSGMTPAAKQTPYLSNTNTRQHMMVGARSYAWGGRLTGAVMKQAGIGAADRKRYGGMVRFDTSTPGGGKSSSFMTFRVMIESSKGWIVPSQPGRYIAKGVYEEMKPKAEEAFKAAVKATAGVK